LHKLKVVGESVLPQGGITRGNVKSHHTLDFEKREQARAHPITDGSRADTVALRQRRFIGEAPIRWVVISC